MAQSSPSLDFPCLTIGYFPTSFNPKADILFSLWFRMDIKTIKSKVLFLGKTDRMEGKPNYSGIKRVNISLSRDPLSKKEQTC